MQDAGVGPTMRALFAAAALLGVMSAITDAQARESRGATTRADAWVGRDAGDLLLQLRVDGGRVRIIEDDEAGETHYVWSSWNPAWTETVTTGGGVVGMVPGGRGFAPTPIFGATEQHEIHHEATHRCDVTFTADLEGIVQRWEYTGRNCRQDIRRPRD